MVSEHPMMNTVLEYLGEDKDSPIELISSSSRSNSTITILVSLVIILCCSLNAYRRNSIWSDEETLWSDCALRSSNKARPHNNLGAAYYDNGKLDEAISVYKKTLAIDSKLAEAHNNLGVATGERRIG
jgi:tetratricopeptide (TPR) repeat protein